MNRDQERALERALQEAHQHKGVSMTLGNGSIIFWGIICAIDKRAKRVTLAGEKPHEDVSLEYCPKFEAALLNAFTLGVVMRIVVPLAPIKAFEGEGAAYGLPDIQAVNLHKASKE